MQSLPSGWPKKNVLSFEKGQGREAIWQGGEDTVLHQADLSLNPVTTQEWIQDSGHTNISVHSWKGGDKSHFAGSWTKCTGSTGRFPRTWESSVTGCTVPVSGPKSLGSDMQQKSSFPACSWNFPSQLPRNSLVLTTWNAHTSHIWEFIHYALLGPLIKAKNPQKSLQSCFLHSAVPWPKSVFAFESVYVTIYLADWLLLWQRHILPQRCRLKSLIWSWLSLSGRLQYLPTIREY